MPIHLREFHSAVVQQLERDVVEVLAVRFGHVVSFSE